MIIEVLMIVIPSLLAAVGMPLAGALTRYRAHYNPIRIQLNEQSRSSNESPVTGYFSTLKRIYQGWLGLYKGTWPSFLSFVFTLLVLQGFDGGVGGKVPWKSDQRGVVQNLMIVIFTLAIKIPLDVLKNRAIVTPYKLSFFNPKAGFHLLLSPTERAKPWKLYSLPGLLPTYLAQFLVPMAMMMARMFLLAVKNKNDLNSPLFMAAAIGFLFFALGCSVVQAPLEVVYVRLSIQRHRSENESFEAEEAQKYGVELYSKENEVITLKDEEAPYDGLWDCTSTIFEEEGWRTLFRAWWITAIGVYVF
ncbi:hypothetical protein VNI00_015897 [Paramarasmius palmivorus]|uniref:Mitochondrial carrier n=1 Tax=Paramarasmius palmivorus TaxID=297713 RepID=A0AAW0BGW6_9AGAR